MSAFRASEKRSGILEYTCVCLCVLEEKSEALAFFFDWREPCVFSLYP